MAEQKKFDIKHHKNDEYHILYIEGNLDSLSCSDAEKVILEAIENANAVIINLDNLIYISSAGLRIILVAAKKSKKKNSHLIFCSPNENIKKIFEVSNFHTILEIAETLEEALNKLKQ